MNQENKLSHLDLEASLDKLERIVSSMERGKLSIEESLSQFEAGVQLTKHCQQALKQAAQKVSLLLDKEGQAELIPYDLDENPDG